MSTLRPEPNISPDAPMRTGVVLLNLGSPEAPTPKAVREYLGEFLSDSRVVEVPRLLWWPILHGIILRTRPTRSAQKYASIWMNEGSPLQVHCARQAKLLKGFLGAQGHSISVASAMRYGQPAIATVLDQLKATGCGRILLLPLFPQYASSTTGSALAEAFGWARTTRNQPELRTVKGFADHPGYISALEQSVRKHWMINGHPASSYRLIISFHGVPKDMIDKGDPYYSECQTTARLLTTALGLREEQFCISFQSRFGRSQWLSPATSQTLKELGRIGTSRVDVICPGFTADCLETLEEIAIEGKAEFLQAGGKEFHYIACLNESDAWIQALADIAANHLRGW